MSVTRAAKYLNGADIGKAIRVYDWEYRKHEQGTLTSFTVNAYYVAVHLDDSNYPIWVEQESPVTITGTKP